MICYRGRVAWYWFNDFVATFEVCLQSKRTIKYCGQTQTLLIPPNQIYKCWCQIKRKRQRDAKLAPTWGVKWPLKPSKSLLQHWSEPVVAASTGQHRCHWSLIRPNNLWFPCPQKQAIHRFATPTLHLLSHNSWHLVLVWSALVNRVSTKILWRFFQESALKNLLRLETCINH